MRAELGDRARLWRVLVPGVLMLGCRSVPPPAGLAASALADRSFAWVRREVPGFRVHFLERSYAAAHQDSLLARLPPALAHARDLIHAPALSGPIDLFFIESRVQMTALTGARATGFAQPSASAVFLVTNPEWRAFERHEIMHVVAERTWGSPAAGTEWLQEGLAQAADGMCAGYPNAEVAAALAARHGWLTLDAVLRRFREQPDVRAYLQAAAFTETLLREHGPAPLRRLWREGAGPGSRVAGLPLAVLERRWREALSAPLPLRVGTLARVESRGCG